MEKGRWEGAGGRRGGGRSIVFKYLKVVMWKRDLCEFLCRI